jgi:alcohol dehydrogenase class IV
MYYGSGTVKANLIDCLPSESSKAFIITGSSLANKTPLVKQVEELLGSKHHAGTFSKIGQHAPIKELDEATKQVKNDPSIDTIISIGGGSPIDSAKAISYRVHETSDKFLHHIAIPTTLSAAECSFVAGYTKEDGVKVGVAHPNLYPSVIIYDSTFGLYTPSHLWLSTGMRALDHAVELQYHPTASEVPCRSSCAAAVRDLFTYLPKAREDPQNEDTITRLYLAAFNSLFFLGKNTKGSLGLSHTFGYALGSPYQIPHGVTSCLTLGHVVKAKTAQSEENAKRCADLLPMIGGSRTSDDVKDGNAVGDAIIDLVQKLGLKTTLTEYGVSKDQVDVICQRATGGQKEGEQYEAVKKIVLTLY